MLTIAIANHANSNSRGSQQVQVEAGTTVQGVLAKAGITVGEGQTVSLNGVDTTLTSVVRVDGFLAITGEAKAAK